MTWIVAMTKPNCEGIAAIHLERQAFEPYFPRFLQTHSPKDPAVKLKTPQIRALFPRYIFIRITDAWYSILGTRGISRVLMGDVGPQIVSEIEIARMKSNEGKDGLLRLPTQPKFDPGTPVKATEGPFVGLPLIYENMTANERCTVLLSNMLGRVVRTEMDEKSLIAA